MEINKSKLNQVEIFEISGSIDANNAKDFDNIVTQSIEEGVTKIIIDLKNMEYISSSGLRAFLCVAKKIGNSGFIYLCSLQPQVSQIFSVSGFNNYFSIFENKETALKKAQ
jgi:anti-anti-sigma factor